MFCCSSRQVLLSHLLNGFGGLGTPGRFAQLNSDDSVFDPPGLSAQRRGEPREPSYPARMMNKSSSSSSRRPYMSDHLMFASRNMLVLDEKWRIEM